MSDNRLGGSSDQWLHQYYKPTDGAGLFQDATVVATSAAAATGYMLSPDNSSITTSTGGQLNAKGCTPKPIRRRSRVSKGTPVTLLNTNTTNFRAMVQQFTGCQSVSTASFVAQSGPINLNFSSKSMKNIPFGYNYGCQQTPIQAQPQQQQGQRHQHPQHQQEMYYRAQQSVLAFENAPSEVVAYPSSACCNNPTPNIQAPADEFLLENGSLYELIGGA